MKVQLDEHGYVSSFAIIGDLMDATEVPDPDDLGHFFQYHSAYRMGEDRLVFDNTHQEALATQEERMQFRVRREAECFSVINRGQLWYDTLTATQRRELRLWYQAWLDGTETLTVPERPAWLK